MAFSSTAAAAEAEHASPAPVAAIVGRWKETHQYKQTLRDTETPRTEDGGMSSAGATALLEQIPPAIAWLSQLIVADREQMNDRMTKIETMLETKTQTGEAISAVVSEELRKHQMWEAERFRKLAALITKDSNRQLGGEEGSALGLATSSVDIRSSYSPPMVTSVATDKAVNVAKTEQPMLAAQEFWSESEPQSPADPRQSPGTLQKAASTDSIDDMYARTPDRGLVHETDRMQKHLARMKAVQQSTQVSWFLAKCFGLTHETFKELKKKPDTCLQAYVDTRAFEFITLSIVTANGFWIGWQTEMQMRDVSYPEKDIDFSFHRPVELCFSIAFIIELVLRLAAFRMYFFTSNDRYWNMYDFVIVCFAVCELVFDTINLSFMRTLRVVRLARVTRVIRVLRFFKGLRYLLCTLMASAAMLTWTVVFLAFLMYVFAIVFMQTCVLYIDDGDAVLVERVRKYYGSVSRTMFTLLMVVTGGQDWEVLLHPLQDVTIVLVPIFVVYVIISLYGILNIVTAVFVEHARELKARDRDLAVHKEMEDSEAFGRQLREFYAEEGLAKDDTLDWSTFQNIIGRGHVQMFLQTHGIDVADAEELFVLIDVDREGCIAVNDFIFGCQRLKGVAKGMDVVLLYDQVVQTRTRLTSMIDKQHVLHREIRRSQDRMREDISHSTQVLREVSADFYVQLNILRQSIEGKTISHKFGGI